MYIPSNLCSDYILLKLHFKNTKILNCDYFLKANTKFSYCKEDALIFTLSLNKINNFIPITLFTLRQHNQNNKTVDLKSTTNQFLVKKSQLLGPHLTRDYETVKILLLMSMLFH